MWKTVSIGETCFITDYVANGSFQSLRENVQYLDDDGYAILVRLTDFTKNWNGNYKYVSKDAYNFLSKSSLQVGDLIISNVGEPGKTFLVPDLGMPMTLAPNSILVRPNSSEISTQFLKYYIDSPHGQRLIKSIESGTTQRKFNKTSFRALQIFAPPLTEQQRIVAKLDAAFAEIDKALASTTKKTKHMETLSFQSINEIITKNCTEVITKPLQALLKLSSGKFLPKNKMQGDGNVKVYGGNGVVGTHNIANLEGQNVVIGRVGAKCGNVHFVNESIWLTDNAMYVHSLKNEFNLEFLKTILASLNLGSYARQSAQPVISFSSIKDVEISFPISLEEQNKVVEELHKFKTFFDELIDIYGYKSIQLDALKSAILAQALQSEVL